MLGVMQGNAVNRAEGRAVPTIRPWSEHDADQTAAMPAQLWQGGDQSRALCLHQFDVHGPARDGDGTFGRTLVASSADAIAGVATVREIWLHPTRWRIAVSVDPAHRRQGIGSRLLDGLVQISKRRDRRPLPMG